MNLSTHPATSQKMFHETFLNTCHPIMNRKGNPLPAPPYVGLLTQGSQEKGGNSGLRQCRLVMWPNIPAGHSLRCLRPSGTAVPSKLLSRQKEHPDSRKGHSYRPQGAHFVGRPVRGRSAEFTVRNGGCESGLSS